MATKILSCFPAHLEPREVQKNALLELEKSWNQGNVFVINLPVASGKSAISLAISRWVKKCSIITPSKLLVNQYAKEYPKVHVLRAKADYYCTTFKCAVNKRPSGKKIPRTCSKDLDCDGCHQYLKDLRKARVMPYLISNYYIYMAHKLYRPTLVIDEAHQLIPMLKQMARRWFTYEKYQWPSSLKTRDDIKRWVNSLPPERFNYHYKADGDRTWADQTALRFLKAEMNSKRPKFLIRMGAERGKDAIFMEPLDIRDEPPFMWPNSVEKIVLMSATISRKDIEQLGLAGKKIIYIEADSPITAERRPVIIPEQARSMSFKNLQTNLPHLVSYIKELASYHSKEKGLIHATYGLAELLRKELQGDDRFIFHDRKNKMKQYEHYREVEEPKILVASGMYEGIDLPYDAGRWQLLAKVPWPSLADEAIKYMASVDEDYYAWETVKTVLQGCGRICRTPTDYGVTYCFDNTFKRLYNQHSEFFPLWFQNSVVFEEEDS